MKIEITAGWHIGLGFAFSKEGLILIFPIVIIMVEFGRYGFSFNFLKNF